MRTHIDWLTFTMTPRYGNEPDGTSIEDSYALAIESAWKATFRRKTLKEGFGGTWQKCEKSRAPYTDAWTLNGCGITLFASISLTHCCVEISGKGCERLIEKNLIGQVLSAVSPRVTRIDIATDIETNVTPTEFVGVTNHDRMRSSGFQKSETGETCYVGSQKSDRYARVYRYNKPHPRSHLLRIEHVFRRDYAKKVAGEIGNVGVESVASSAGFAFGWKHDIWQTGGGTDTDISLVFERRDTGKTVFWLTHSCASAFKRLCADGTIREPQAFLDAYFLSTDNDA